MKKTSVILIIVGILSLSLGFYLGKMYAVYQMKQAFLEGFGNAFNTKPLSKNTENKNKKEDVIVAMGNSYTFSKGEGKTMKVGVRKIFNLGKIENFNNDAIFVIMQGENTGKKLSNKYMSSYSVLLETKDGAEYRPSSVDQVTRSSGLHLPEGFGGCISCESNPGEKNMEIIGFDIPAEKMEGAKLKLDEKDNVSFLLEAGEVIENFGNGIDL